MRAIESMNQFFRLRTSSFFAKIFSRTSGGTVNRKRTASRTSSSSRPVIFSLLLPGHSISHCCLPSRIVSSLRPAFLNSSATISSSFTFCIYTAMNILTFPTEEARQAALRIIEELVQRTDDHAKRKLYVQQRLRIVLASISEPVLTRPDYPGLGPFHH